MKNKFKYLLSIFSIFIFVGCVYPFAPYKSHFRTVLFNNYPYAIMNNEKFDRMGIEKNDTRKIADIISKKYGIAFNTGDRIYVVGGISEEYQIKFYDDIKVIVKDKIHIVPKEKMKNEQGYYDYGPIPKEIRNYKVDDDYILDIGEIEILDQDGKVIRPRTKVPPILFKISVYRFYSYNPGGTNVDVYYDG